MYIILKYVLIKIKIKLHNKYMSSCNNLLNIFWCGGEQMWGFALLCQKYIESLKTCPLPQNLPPPSFLKKWTESICYA